MGDKEHGDQDPNTTAWVFSADRPILSRKDDKFQRAGFADALIAQVLALPKNDSFVLGLAGPWGSGKTSILSMVEEDMASSEEVVPLKFNPWLFSGTEQLAAHFFQEIAAQLHESKDKKLQQIGDTLVSYSDALSPLSTLPFIGKWADRIAKGGKFFGSLLRSKGGALPTSISAQRRAISKLLKEHSKRLLVIVDDIDRLPKADIRELFKLVRLTADFPNMTYILAFDRPRVEAALGETEGEGRAYLEKILQVTFDVPRLRQMDLDLFLQQEIAAAVGNLVHGPFDKSEWTNILFLALSPLFRTPRDVRRYTNGIPVALSVLGNEIALHDLLAIEAIRSLLPDVWSQIHSCANLLTDTKERLPSSARVSNDEEAKFEALLVAAGEHRLAVRQFFARVFPPARRFIDNHSYGLESSQRWKKARRLASPDVLRFYFEQSLPKGVFRAQAVHEIFEKLGNEEALRLELSKFDEEMLEHICSRLELYEGDFSQDVVEPALVVLFENYPRLREGQRGFLDFGGDFAISRLALRLLKCVKEEPLRNDIVQRVLPRIRTLSARKNLLDVVGWRKGVGSKLISLSISSELEADLQKKIVNASTPDLATERHLFALLDWVDDGDSTISKVAKIAIEDDKFLLRLLRSGLRTTTRQGWGEVAQYEQQTLPWDYVVDLIGEAELAVRISAVNDRRAALNLDERDELAIDTALRYLGGWRPGPLMEDEHIRDQRDISAVARGEERMYGASILFKLLESVVPARRLVARDRVTHMLDRGVKVPQEVVERLVEMAASEDFVATERTTSIDLLRRLDAEDRVLIPLTSQWFVSTAVSPELSQRIGAFYLDRPEHVPRLLDVLEQVEVSKANAERLREGVLAVASLFEQKSASLSDEVATRALQAVERFDGLQAVQSAVERARKMHPGERS